ncbi:unnamed protein product [marine sediment metagenome]|uniref:Uncharacterized protein n=1 Tax=marine sediment metagenome TaxID=412755 RepID=X1QWY1_9ZZZZ
MAREVTNCVITNLIAVGSIYQYLSQNWHLKQIRVDLTFPHAGEQRTITERILSKEKVDYLYKFMLDKWKSGKLRVVITETDGP